LILIKSWKLNNGATLIVEDIPYLRSAAIGVFIKVGSRHEPNSIAGASHFVEHMIFKGTESRSAREIAESFESIGGQLNAFTSREYTCVYARTLDENVDLAMDIIFDMLFNSSMTQKDFDTEKNVIIEEINMYEDTPDELIHDIFARKMWEGHPMGVPILGYLNTIQNMVRDDLIKYYKSNYVTSNLIISVAGNVDHHKIMDGIEKRCENAPHKMAEHIVEKPIERTSFISLVPKETEQVQICLGVPGISYKDENRYKQNIMNSILGGGISSRLFQSLREELGLAYSVYSYPSNYSDTGSYCICIGTGPSKLSKFFNALNEQMDLFIREGATDAEINRTRQLNKSNILLSLESVMNRMNRQAKSLLMYDRVIPPEEVIERMYQVDAGSVHEFTGNMLKRDFLSIAAIGSKDVLPVVEQEYKKLWG
ncbi:MAG TPA: pitrilysin family protein, partial [Syntrophomonadaceae bacterium]|nr:pitrilysin family protein [Syntrophomonadaceae bacterium]